MTQLDLFEQNPTIKCSGDYMLLGDLIKLHGVIYEVCSVQRFRDGFREYGYRPYEGTL